MGKRRVLIVDDHTLFRTGLSMILGQHEGIASVTEAGSVEEALGLSQQETMQDAGVDLVLLDIQMPGMSGLDGIKTLQKTFAEPPVIMLSASHEPGMVQRAARQGAMGFLHKSASAAEILRAIEQVMAGEQLFEPDVIQENNPALQENRLTSRQKDVLNLLCEGKTNKIIARELGMAENTVRVHVSAILAQLGAANRAEAILLAQRHGMVTAPV